MLTGTRCRAVVSLCLLALVLAVSAADARTLPHGAVRLAHGDYKGVGAAVQCGRIAGRWVPGARLLSWWFVSDARQARNLAAAAHRARGAARRTDLLRAGLYRRRAAARQAACGPLRFRLRGASGLALRGSSRYRGSDLSNLDVVTRRGRLRDAVTSGAANVVRMFTAPSGKVYVLFRGLTRIDGGAPQGDTSGDGCDSGGDTTCDGSSDTGAVYCLLAEVDPASNVPTCVDPELSYLRRTDVPGLNDPVQFDSQGAIYYVGSSYRGVVLRRYLNGTTTDYLSSANLRIDDLLALGDGDVLITGASVPTGARWVRRIGVDGHVHNVRSFSANWLRLFPDGNAYVGMWASGDRGVLQFSAATNTIADTSWLAHESDHATFDVESVCAGADAATIDAFCAPLGTLLTTTVTTSTGKVYAVAGTQTDARLVQYYPAVQLVPSTVHKVAAAEPVGDDVALAGVDAADRQVLVLHDTATDTERPLIGPDAELEVYHLSYDAKAGQLLFDGLRFSDDKYVLGKVDLATGAVTIDDTSTQAWTDVEVPHWR